MENSLKPLERNDSVLHEYPKEQIDLIRKMVAPGASDDELKFFLLHCKRTGLDPFAKQIFFQKRRSNKGEDKITIVVAVDGYRSIACRTGEYAGSDDSLFDDEQNPRKATCTVYRLVKGHKCAFTASARWDQYYPGEQLGFMWRKMPHVMLGKCAEGLALRKAFPLEMGGTYVKEEMDQADTLTVEPEKSDGYDPAVPAMQEKLEKYLSTVQRRNDLVFTPAQIDEIEKRITGRHSDDLPDIILSVIGRDISLK